MIPHMTEIKHKIVAGAQDADIAIVEIGAVGDIESLPFLKLSVATRLACRFNASHISAVYATLVTKPTTQHSVKNSVDWFTARCSDCRSDYEVDISSRKLRYSQTVKASSDSLERCRQSIESQACPRQGLDQLIVDKLSLGANGHLVKG